MGVLFYRQRVAAGSAGREEHQADRDGRLLEAHASYPSAGDLAWRLVHYNPTRTLIVPAREDTYLRFAGAMPPLSLGQAPVSRGDRLRVEWQSYSGSAGWLPVGVVIE